MQNFLGLCHLFDPLLHLVANVISELGMHEDMLSPWRGECDSDQVSWWFGSMMLTWIRTFRLGFNSPLRHRIFSDRVTYSTHSYSNAPRNTEERSDVTKTHYGTALTTVAMQGVARCCFVHITSLSDSM